MSDRVVAVPMERRSWFEKNLQKLPETQDERIERQQADILGGTVTPRTDRLLKQATAHRDRGDRDLAEDTNALAAWDAGSTVLFTRLFTESQINVASLVTTTVLPELTRQATSLRTQPKLPVGERTDRLRMAGQDLAATIDQSRRKGCPAEAMLAAQQLQAMLAHPSASPPPDDRDETEMTAAEVQRRKADGTKLRETRKGLLKSTVDQAGALAGSLVPGSNEEIAATALKAQAERELKFAGVAAPDPYRAKLFEAPLRDAMDKLELKFAGVVADAAMSKVFDKLGTKLAGVLDEMMRAAVTKFFDPKKGGMPGYSAEMDKLLADPTALFEKCPGLQAQIDRECDNFQRNVGEVLDQAGQDKDALKDGLFGGSAINGLTDLTVADSDPHNGGRRVTILEFDTEDGPKKVVNKPRDVRVDAKFVGRTDDGSGMSEIASALLKSKRGDAQDLPTYGFLPMNKEDEHPYGWVEFVEHGEKDDCVLDEPKAKEFYRQTGQLQALALLFGMEDLHQGNMMIRKGQPVLTDLEIAFSSKTYDPALSPEPPDKVEDLDPNLVKAGIKTKITNTMLDKAITGGTQIKQIGPGLASGDTLRSRPLEGKTMTPEETTENTLVVDTAEGPITQMSGAPNRFKDDMLAGFNEMIDALADPANAETIEKLIASFGGMHVRYHAMATAEQLKQRRMMMNKGFPEEKKKDLDELKSSEQMMDEQVRGSDLVQSRLRTNPDFKNLLPVMSKDLGERDVAYFTQALGSKEVLHNGTDKIPRDKPEEDQATDVELATDGLDVARQNIALFTQHADTVKLALKEYYDPKLPDLGQPSNDNLPPSMKDRLDELLK